MNISNNFVCPLKSGVYQFIKMSMAMLSLNHYILKNVVYKNICDKEVCSLVFGTVVCLSKSLWRYSFFF